MIEWVFNSFQELLLPCNHKFHPNTRTTVFHPMMTQIHQVNKAEAQTAQVKRRKRRIKRRRTRESRSITILSHSKGTRGSSMRKIWFKNLESTVFRWWWTLFKSKIEKFKAYLKNMFNLFKRTLTNTVDSKAEEIRVNCFRI